MKDYYDTKRRKSVSYLYYGLAAAGFAALMIVAGILAVSRDADTGIIVTAFIAAALWGITSFVSLYMFYADNRAELNSDKLDSSEL